VSIMSDVGALGFDVTRRARLPARVERDLAQGRCNGVALRVARHGMVVVDLCRGHADIDSGRALDGDAVFHLMSLAKALRGRLPALDRRRRVSSDHADRRSPAGVRARR
jgi:hypothetical protein